MIDKYTRGLGCRARALSFDNIAIRSYDPRMRQKQAQARAWLEAKLAAGPRPASEVKAAASAAGHSLRTLERAKAQPPRILSEKRLQAGRWGPWWWSLFPGTRLDRYRDGSLVRS